MPGSPDFGGSPISTGANNLLNTATITVAQHATSKKTVAISRPGYQVQLALWNSTSSVVSMPVTVSLFWQDINSGDVMARQEHHILAGSVSNNIFIDGTGPTIGNQLLLEITNNCASADTLSYAVLVNEVSTQYPFHNWTTDDKFSFSPAGWTPLNDDMVAGLLACTAGHSVGIGATQTFVLPYYRGPVYVTCTTASGTSDLSVQIIAEADTGVPAVFPVWSGKTDGNGNVAALTWLPNIQCAIVVTNHNAAAQNVSLSVVTAQSD
jgi:hypothetical protein